MSRHRLNHNRGTGNRHQQPGHVHSGHGTPAHGNLSHQQKHQGYISHAAGSPLSVQQRRFVPQHFPFQPLPPPNGHPPFRFDLSQLLHIEEVQKITQAGKLAFHSIGDTGDERGKEMDFVARMMTDDYDAALTTRYQRSSTISAMWSTSPVTSTNTASASTKRTRNILVRLSLFRAITIASRMTHRTGL